MCGAASRQCGLRCGASTPCCVCAVRERRPEGRRAAVVRLPMVGSELRIRAKRRSPIAKTVGTAPIPPRGEWAPMHAADRRNASGEVTCGVSPVKFPGNASGCPSAVALPWCRTASAPVVHRQAIVFPGDGSDVGRCSSGVCGTGEGLDAAGPAFLIHAAGLTLAGPSFTEETAGFRECKLPISPPQASSPGSCVFRQIIAIDIDVAFTGANAPSAAGYALFLKASELPTSPEGDARAEL